VLLVGSYSNNQPVFVHRHLLNGRSLDCGTIYRTALADETTKKSGDHINILTIKVSLDSLRAIEMWSRWLYGQPMWSEDDCTNVDDDLVCLTEILYLCGGHANSKGKDYEGLNGCMDAIRNLMLNETHVPDSPIQVLSDELEHSEILVKMLAEVMVHSKYVSDGRTKKWLELNEGDNQSFLDAISNAFARKAVGEAAPDLMARCAYHTHPSGSECEPAPRGRAWTGKSRQQRNIRKHDTDRSAPPADPKNTVSLRKAAVSTRVLMST
jgi:hypothetical protein